MPTKLKADLARYVVILQFPNFLIMIKKLKIEIISLKALQKFKVLQMEIKVKIKTSQLSPPSLIIRVFFMKIKVLKLIIKSMDYNNLGNFNQLMNKVHNK